MFFCVAISPEAFRQALMEGLESQQFPLSVAPAARDQMAGALSNFPWHTGSTGTRGSATTVAPGVAAVGASTSVADAHCCGDCWRKILAELLYQYREAIPSRYARQGCLACACLLCAPFYV